MPHPPETWAQARRFYEDQGLDVATIAAMLKVSAGAVYDHAKSEHWVRPLDHRGRLPLSGVGVSARRRITARLFAAFERQVRDLESRLAALDGREADDRDARTLATLAQTLDRLVVLDDSVHAPDAGGEEEPDIDEFRSDLARRLEELGARRHPEPAGEPDEG